MTRYHPALRQGGGGRSSAIGYTDRLVHGKQPGPELADGLRKRTFDARLRPVTVRIVALCDCVRPNLARCPGNQWLEDLIIKGG